MTRRSGTALPEAPSLWWHLQTFAPWVLPHGVVPAALVVIAVHFPLELVKNDRSLLVHVKRLAVAISTSSKETDALRHVATVHDAQGIRTVIASALLFCIRVLDAATQGDLTFEGGSGPCGVVPAAAKDLDSCVKGSKLIVWRVVKTLL